MLSKNMINLGSFRKRVGLVSITATLLATSTILGLSCGDSSKADKYNVLEATNQITLNGEQRSASVWGQEGNPSAKRVLISPYTLIDGNGDKKVDSIGYSIDYTGPKLSQEQADSIFHNATN